MKTNEISKNNKLIAGFMGVFPTGNNWYDGRELKKAGLPFSPGLMGNGTNELKFHSSWDRLMPVIQKILDLSFQDGKNAEDFYNIRDCMPDINHTYKAVIEYIKSI